MSAFSYVSSRLGNVKPETRLIAQEIHSAAEAAGHEIWFMWGMGTSTEHSSGLALDLMVRNEAGGDFCRNYLWEHRVRLRLRHVIWEQNITSTVIHSGVRRKMADRGNPTANHFDHVHTWHFAGTYQPLDGTPPTTGRLSVDGKLGPRTIAKWQAIMGTKVDGKISAKNSQLVRAVQTKLKSLVDHRLEIDGVGIHQDGKRSKTIGALQRYLKSPVDEIMSVPVSNVVKALQRRLNENRF
jgi:hypothetical protein